jgi:hypothetical protein
VCVSNGGSNCVCVSNGVCLIACMCVVVCVYLIVCVCLIVCDLETSEVGRSMPVWPVGSQKEKINRTL